jgi:DNA-binding CsgD family transcriptional regulator/PAS domain-containing protein
LLDDQPWQGLLRELRALAQADSSTLILRRPSEFDKGTILADGLGNNDPIATDNPYSDYFYKLDPFVNLPEGRVVTLEEFVDAEALLNSEFYLHYLAPANVHHILGVDVRDESGNSASMRLMRSATAEKFSDSNKLACELLVPHLRQALRLYSRLLSTESERSVYAGAVNQLSIACIIVDKNRQILRTNSGADELFAQNSGISERHGRLQLDQRDKNRELIEVIDDILAAQNRGTVSLARALSAPRGQGRAPLGLVVKPVPRVEWLENQSSPSVVVFLSDPQQDLDTSTEALRRLFELTPAEARLSILLANGASLDSAAETLGISKHTGRAHLRAIFSKTGVTQQSQLVSLILRSVAGLG